MSVIWNSESYADGDFSTFGNVGLLCDESTVENHLDPGLATFAGDDLTEPQITTFT
ncbi:hypothetical protein B0A55_09940 [Friedmanniomyces simplex]|uniref:Uncharacterized protein n=1 Tax=Friedmanniomyces simplex TaxID=329884 RepID=A0A4U0WN89_9PEZI|nr:hypothetical protein B0A55_09940 [Friedmanniomyces simplex]